MVFNYPKIKTVSQVFEKTTKEDGFRLFANVDLDKDESSTEYVQDGLGHDHRYSVNRLKIEGLGNRGSHDFEDKLQLLEDWLLNEYA